MRLFSKAGPEILVGLLPLALVGWVIFELLGGMGASIAGMALLPTLASLSLVWLFFAGRLVMKLIRLRAGGGAPDTVTAEASGASTGAQAFDADAVLANYMRGRDAASGSAIAPDAVKEEGQRLGPSPGGFGRKIV